MAASEQFDFVYDWANHGPRAATWPAHVMIDDETLRDGLQSPSVVDPPIDAKVRILYLMESFGIETADVGLPGAGTRQREDVLRLCREMSDRHMRIRPNCAARTMIVDIRPIAEVSQLVGIAIETCLFIGSSPIRQYAEGWDIERIRRQSVEAISFATREGLPVMFVTEDTVRSSPNDMRVLITAAIEAGAARVCLCDTCGAATPEATFNLVTFVKELISEVAPQVGIDWHG
ncbi:MAG: hypothetical protein ACRD3E_07430, partial [Terriglobales bacterium]